MDIGSEFDDDFFEKPREKEGSETSNYEAKICVPLWYMETQNKESADTLVALKHQADYNYFSENYAKAAEAYERCLQLVPPSNNTWKREFMENLSRSYLRLGNSEKALEWSLKLYGSSFSADQKVVSMNLLATVCHTLGKYNEELEALHYCVEAHKSCPEFWMRLGLCYAGLFKINLPGYPVLKSNTEEDQEPCCAFNMKTTCQNQDSQEKDISPSDSTQECAIASSSSSPCTDACSESEESTSKCELCTLGVQIVSSCLIHTRELIDSGGPNRLGNERDEKMKEKIASSLKHMEVDQSFIDVASKELGTDFLPGVPESADKDVEQQQSKLEKLKLDNM